MASDHGKKRRAGHAIKTVLAVIGGITVVVAVLLVALVYELNYAVRTVDTSTSPDGRFTLELQAVGEPLFFSPADARLVLRLGRYEVSHVDTSIADDGGQVRPTSWQVSWEDTGAEVRLRGSEQGDELVTMGFDGSVRGVGQPRTRAWAICQTRRQTRLPRQPMTASHPPRSRDRRPRR